MLSTIFAVDVIWESAVEDYASVRLDKGMRNECSAFGGCERFGESAVEDFASVGLDKR